MSNKFTLTIKKYHNDGSSQTLNLESYKIENQNRLIVSRLPDHYSSRLAMMANLNKNSHSLSWGFTEMSLFVETFSEAGFLISHRFYVFTSVAVADLLPRDSYDLIIFAFNEKSEFCVGQC
jgi:hypothetical protein